MLTSAIRNSQEFSHSLSRGRFVLSPSDSFLKREEGKHVFKPIFSISSGFSREWRAGSHFEMCWFRISVRIPGQHFDQSYTSRLHLQVMPCVVVSVVHKHSPHPPRDFWWSKVLPNTELVGLVFSNIKFIIRWGGGGVFRLVFPGIAMWLLECSEWFILCCYAVVLCSGFMALICGCLGVLKGLVHF